jgi:uncharacterized protein (TIGR02270 family)
VDPRARLDGLLEDEQLVRRRALRLVGELGRSDLRDQLSPWLTAQDEVSRFWAAWSAGLLGNRTSTIPVLQSFAAVDGPFKWQASDLIIRCMDRESAVSWLRALGQDRGHSRLIVVAVGVLGDPTAMPWLIAQMQEPSLARVAGESFSMITGVDLSEHNLVGSPPADFTGAPTDEPTDEGVELDVDENLPWPDCTKVQRYWGRISQGYLKGARYILGAPLTEASCFDTLLNGGQRQRRAAAYELVMASPGRQLWNWRGRAGRQIETLRTPAHRGVNTARA